jgi:hypothetical protein
MSLLTNEQIAELIGIASNQSTSRDLHSEFHEWNEKQIPSIEFEPDWGNVPSNITRVYLDAVWFNSEMKEIERTTICCWDKPIPPHPHAEMIMKYAEVAQRRTDPWVEFEVTSSEEFSWSKCNSFICFRAEYEYRHIGDNK